MKTWMLVGIALVCLGAFVLILGLKYGTQHSVMRVGDFQASVEEQRTVPAWVGGVAVVGGLLLVGVGARKPRA